MSLRLSARKKVGVPAIGNKATIGMDVPIVILRIHLSIGKDTASFRLRDHPTGRGTIPLGRKNVPLDLDPLGPDGLSPDPDMLKRSLSIRFENRLHTMW